MGILKQPQYTKSSLKVHKPKEGLLKPKENGLFGKLSKFLSKYSLTGYEDDIDTEDLEKSIPLAGYQTLPRKKLRYDDGNYVKGELPVMGRSKENGQYRKPYNNNRATRTRFSPRFESYEPEPKPFKSFDLPYKSKRDSTRLKSEVGEIGNFGLDQSHLVSQLTHKTTENHKLSEILKTYKHEVESLENDRRTADQQINHLATELTKCQTICRQLNDRVTDFTDQNLELIRENLDLTHENLDLTHENLELQSTVLSQQSVITDLNSHLTSANSQILDLLLQVNDKEYQNQLLYLNHEYQRYNLLENPRVALKFYSQINDKLEEFMQYSDHNQDYVEVRHYYDLQTIHDLKRLVEKLYGDLTEKFTRNIGKTSSKSLHFLSCNYKLREKSLRLLHQLDEIIIILLVSGPEIEPII